jgi:cytosine deaminase
MTVESLLPLGMQQLRTITQKSDDIEYWKGWLANYKFDCKYPDDGYVWLTCVLALKAVSLGNFGIGCILVDGKGGIVAWGHNEVFHPYFRSDRHAEMVVMDMFEDNHKEITSLKGYRLYTSLESCPMCLARLITSGSETVLHAASDNDGGMVHKIKDLPKIWIELSKGRIIKEAHCSQALIKAASQIFLISSSELNEKLQNR